MRIPKDAHLSWSRDFSFLNTYLIAHQHTHVLQRHLGAGFTWCAFVYQQDRVDFYRSRAEEARFNRTVGERCLSSKSYLRRLVAGTIARTDQLRGFMKNEERLRNGNVETFIALLDDHFPYHLGVYWAADHIAMLPQTRRTKMVFAQLDRARKYNETIFPDVERWLTRQRRILPLTRDELMLYGRTGHYPIPSDEAKRRARRACVTFDRSTAFLSSGLHARQDVERLESLRPHDGTNSDQLRGTGVTLGVFRGRVRKVLTFRQLSRVRAGDVLVTRMTLPQFNVTIRKAGAIVTDEGALLSHAAIVAREFNIPCVVGTRVATELLNDGDLVEVDSTNGIVCVVSRK